MKGIVKAVLGLLRRAAPAEAARSVEQQRAELLVRATQAGLLEWDAAADVTTYSGRLKEMLGCPADAETSRWQFFDLVHPEDRERIRASFLAQLRERGTRGGVRQSHDPADYRLRRADGSYLWIHAEAISLTGEDGRTLRYICSFIDISERKRQEEALRDHIALTSAIVSQAPNAIFAKDRAGRFTLANRGWSEMSGVPAEQAIGRSVHDLYPPATAKRFAEEDDKLIAQGAAAAPIEALHQGPRPGQYRIVRKAVLSRDGEVLGLVCSSTDITELKRMENELRDQMDLSRSLIEGNPSAMFLKDTEGRYVTVNDAWLKMVGLTREQAIGRNVLELFKEKESERYHAEDMRLLGQQGAGVSEVESLRTGPDGKPQWVIIRKAVLRRADGSVIGLIGANTDITRRKHAEAELAAERQRLALVVSATQAGIIDWDVPAESAWFSDRLKEMLGYPADFDTSAWASTFSALIHPEDRDRSRDVFFTGLVSPGAADSADLQEPLELRLQRADGGWLWVQSMGLTLRDATGEAKRYLAAVTDISARREQDEKLRNQFKFVNDLVDSVPLALAMRDTEGRYLFVNRTWERYFETPRDEVVGRPIRERASGRMADAVLALDRAVLERGPGAMQQEDDFSYRGRRFSQTRSVMVDAQGKVLGVLVASIDTTARFEMEQALARQRERLQLLVRASKAGFLDWDAIADTRAYSERFKEMLGYPPDADSSQWPSLFDMVHPDDLERTRAAFRDMLRTGAATGERLHGPLECRLRKADGSYVWVRGEGIAQIGADGRTERFLASYIDITQLRELNRALEESVRLREEVDRISRHDLKTPISSIVGIPRLLRDSGRIAAEDAELLAMVEQAGYRLLGMVNLSLDMFRMEQGTYPFSPGAVDLLEVLGNVARDLRPQADSLRVALKVEGSRAHARAEALLCYSLLANLVKNAVEASPGGGTVKILLETEQDMVLVRVHNDGAVPEAVRARFFDKYSSAGKKSGTGLGTYSARLMARTQRGDIEMQTSEREGTTLTVRLHSAPAPSAREQAAAIAAAAAPSAEPLRALAVLVVDDDEYTRVVVQRFLPAGTRSRAAANGREALDAVIADPPDAVVMDLDMPVLGGIEAAARIREWERESGRARGALIAMSSHDDAGTRTRCLEAGFDTYLEKPVSPEALRRALAEFARAPLAGDPVRVDRDLEGVLPGFLESRRELAGELARALESGDTEHARAIAHKLAGSLALYGFRWAAGQGKMIERRAKARALEGLADEVAALRRHLDEVKVEVTT